MACIQSVTYGFVNNGRVFGDPISQYIYILCAKGLRDVGLIHGVSIARGTPSISHLLFADDCYMFFRADETEARVIKNVLTRYEKLSGQAINFHKSSIIFSPNTRPQDRNGVCQILRVNEVHEPGKYLGMTMAVGKKMDQCFSS